MRVLFRTCARTTGTGTERVPVPAYFMGNEVTRPQKTLISIPISVSVHINRYTSPGSLKTGEDDDDALTCAPKLRIGKILSFRIKLKRNKINSSRD